MRPPIGLGLKVPDITQIYIYIYTPYNPYITHYSGKGADLEDHEDLVGIPKPSEPHSNPTCYGCSLLTRDL